MASNGQGTIYIPLDEFWSFVAQYAPKHGGEVLYGLPRITAGGEDLEVDYAFSTECHPDTWAAKPPAVLQWVELRKGSKP